MKTEETPSIKNTEDKFRDPAHDVLGIDRRPLDSIFKPRSIAVIGATEKVGSVGRTIFWNLIQTSFGGVVYPVNPTRKSVLGIKAYAKLDDISDQIDLAVIVTPAKTVPAIVEECAKKGIPGAIIISAGFKEGGEEGIALEKQILKIIKRAKMRVIGPNCLGVMMPFSGLNATFAGAMARPGKVAFISQSGALCTAILDWSFKENVGFSAFISVGSMLDVGWGDLIDYLGDDPNTESIVIYMESIGDAQSFLSAAREVALQKPIIVIKAGRTEAAAKAAASHTGSLTGSDDVLEAAFRRVGVLRVNEISELFYMAEILAKQPPPKGPRLCILTNAGGPGVLAADSLVLSGGKLAKISAGIANELNKFLPEHWSHNNPVDVLGDADPERYRKAIEILAKDPENDGILVILTPQAMTNPTETARVIEPHAKLEGKPILASWMGASDVAAGEALLNKANIPTFSYPDTAARMFNYMWRYSDNLRMLYETPALPVGVEEGDSGRHETAQIFQSVLKEKRTLLTESEAKKVLHAYGIPVTLTEVAETEPEAVKLAEKIGYPVVLKLHSLTVTHKTDVGGVKLNIESAAQVKQAFQSIREGVTSKHGKKSFDGVSVQKMVKLKGTEIILGASVDPQFGPVVLFGAGGQWVEVFKDKALGIPPLNTTLARRLMEQTKIYGVLQGARGQKGVDLKLLESLLVQFSRLIVEQPRIKEIDINPLLVSSEGILALDGRIVLHDEKIADEDLPKTAIPPYPIKYQQPWKLKSGERVLFRPIRPEDEPLMVKFHETLSDKSVYLRYMRELNLPDRVTHERLSRLCFVNYDRDMALVVEGKDPKTKEKLLMAVGRIRQLHDSSDAEFSMLVSDPYQHLGIGTELLKRLLEVARDHKVKRVIAKILKENDAIQKLCARLGFKLESDDNSDVVRATLTL